MFDIIVLGGLKVQISYKIESFPGEPDFIADWWCSGIGNKSSHKPVDFVKDRIEENESESDSVLLAIWNNHKQQQFTRGYSQ